MTSTVRNVLSSFAFVLTICLPAQVLHAARSGARPELWLTDPDQGIKFQRQTSMSVGRGASAATTGRIKVNPERKFQEIDGFGFTLTGGSAMHLMRMAPGPRQAILRELFGTDGTNIGVSYLRVSIGASDLNERAFSYDDLAPGEVDPDLQKFSLGPDLEDVVPILQQILEIQPKLKIMGSPWSAPPWMKTNNDFRGGSLKPEYQPAYARYFVKYIAAMAALGINIDAVTVQNEPLHPGNNPSMLMLAPQQAEFVKKHLGPAFQNAKLNTKIIIYDHNCDRPDYPISILNDPVAKPFIAGSAFHLYAGKIDALSEVHRAHPDKHLYFTEQWIGAPGNLPGDLAWHTENLIIGASRNWSRTVLQWNLAADPQHKPHTDRGGCDRCLGAITIDGDRIVRNPAYYIVAQASKFVRPGSFRVDSSMPRGLPNVAFTTPEGKTVLIVLNKTKEMHEFTIESGRESVQAQLTGGAVGTYVW